MLDAMRDATGVVGSTSVSVGAFIKTCGGSWDVPVDRIKMVDDRLFIMLKIEPKLAIIFGTETEAATHDQLFAFFKNLRNRRHEEVFKLMVAVNEKRSLDMNMASRLVRKVLIDEISNSIDVEIEGFTSGYAVDGPIMVPPDVIKMLSALYHHDRPWIELNPDNIEFVRQGVQSVAKDFQRDFKCRGALDFPEYPNARLHKQGFVYCRVRNIDGKIGMKVFPFKASDNDAVMQERRFDAASRAQQHFDESNVAAPSRKRKRNSSSSWQTPVEAPDPDDAADSDDSAAADAQLESGNVDIIDMDAAPSGDGTASASKP